MVGWRWNVVGPDAQALRLGHLLQVTQLLAAIAHHVQGPLDALHVIGVRAKVVCGSFLQGVSISIHSSHDATKLSHADNTP